MLPALLLAFALSGRADSTLLRVLAINDFHGALESRQYSWSGGRPVGGAAALKATLDSAAADCRCPVLRLDGGDELQGTLASNLVQGRSTIEVLRRFGLDAAVVGNHELDWGVDTLRARMGESNWPWLAANVFDSVSGRRPGWARPVVLLERGGLRIALVGYMAARTKQMVRADHVAGLIWRRGAGAIRDALDSARAARPDLTILVAHEGAFCDSLPCRGEIVELARELDSTQVQLIVSGHTHSLVNTVVQGIPIVQARSSGTAFAIADLIRRDDGTRIWRTRVETVWADRVSPDSGVSAILDRYRPMVARLASRPIAVLREELVRRGNQYPLGNLIADAQRAAVPGTDFALMNNGGIRRDLPAGRITYNDVFELQPFGNNLVRVAITGERLKQVLERAVASGRPAFHVSGLKVRYDSRLPVGSRVLEIRTAGGGRVQPGRTYQLALLDFLQSGGEGLSMVVTLPVRRTGQTDLEALIAYLQRSKAPVTAPAAPRFLDVAP
ncbi:MAG TPA: bifunctional UDP-sugar hydrolase/5'-nucleotidase [Gemmatimonadales bacterium]|nr:bifunctional UDP-sugar hydrolase/5'-nucleotidase [Gemmatimonadales bacterium]